METPSPHPALSISTSKLLVVASIPLVYLLPCLPFGVLLFATRNALFMVLADWFSRTFKHLTRLVMDPSAFTAYQNGTANATGNGGIGVHTVTAMGRWSVLNKQLPPADHIRAIHVYDFDNTRKYCFAFGLL